MSVLPVSYCVIILSVPWLCRDESVSRSKAAECTKTDPSKILSISVGSLYNVESYPDSFDPVTPPVNVDAAEVMDANANENLDEFKNDAEKGLTATG
jgi:hypothetical protein